MQGKDMAPSTATVTPPTSNTSSDNQIRLFYFILGHSEDTVSVKIEKDGMVKDLHDAIIKKAGITSKSQLFKPLQPVTVVELEAVLSVKADWRILHNDQSLQQHFDPPPQSGIHIVVQLLSYPLERAPKRQKLGGELEVSSDLYMLWEQTWNRKAETVPWFSLRKTERDGTSALDVPEYCWVFSPPNDIASVLDLNPPTVLFRDDYLRFLSELFASSGLGNFTPSLDRSLGATFPNFFSGVQVPQETPVNGLILTGHPGIGKSICLRIVLILRLCARLPTFYQVNASSILFFSAEGPVELPSNSYDLKSYLRRERTAWALFDSTPSFKDPPNIFLTKKNFIVQTPSPRSYRLAWRSKFPPVSICCLGLWTPAELICAAPFQRRRHDEHALLEFCEKYGYSARDAYGNVSSVQYEKNFQAYCGTLSYDSVAKIITGVQALHFPDNVQHDIICITPTQVGLKYSFDFVSEHVYRCVLESLRVSEANAAARLYRLFLRIRKTRAPAGYMLEPAAHEILINGGSFDIIRLEDWKTPQTVVDEDHTRLHITSSSISVGRDRVSPLGRPPVFEFRKEGGPLELFGFYCPTSKSQATFDFLVYDPKDRHAWVFQVIVSPSHTVTEKGIKELLGRGVDRISYIAITSEFLAAIDSSPYLNEVVTCKYQLVLR